MQRKWFSFLFSAPLSHTCRYYDTLLEMFRLCCSIFGVTLVHLMCGSIKNKKAKENRKTNASLGGHWFDWFSMISMIISNQLWLRLMKSFGSNLNGEWRAADGAKWVFVVNKPKNAELADGEFRGLTELTKWKGKKSKQVEVKSGKVNWIILGNCMWLMRNSLCGKSRLKCWIFIVFFQNILDGFYILGWIVLKIYIYI